ncbi:hypothetical protein D2E76_16615 [Mycobacteroides abscessus]|uniref:Lipoprotein LpqN n=1 Tax=Mycobacteroides abscessus TaxID=36809 RepID=A0ABD7HM53_9MYCO|nr:hypothetical protein [Mycobacteroides abscessus]RIT36871.1 hypothetical protein D2E76_16615 [Mycobacteroides abscessus]
MLGAAVVVTLALTAGISMFTAMFASPSIGAMAFQPYADGPLRLDPSEAAQARRDILADKSNPLRCVARTDMWSQAHPVMGLAENSAPADAPPEAPAGGEPIQITDSTAAVLPGIEQVIATLPVGTDFFEAYAFVVTAVNGGVDSWQRFLSVTTQMRLGTPINRTSAMNTVHVFFTEDSQFSSTDALAAAVMLRLTSSHMINGGEHAMALLEDAVNRCA